MSGACGAWRQGVGCTGPPAPQLTPSGPAPPPQRCSYGNNNQGQATVPTPQDPYDSTAIVEEWLQVSAGYNHTCAITLYNDLYCWGSSANGRTTIPATGDNDWVYVSAGAKHTCE